MSAKLVQAINAAVAFVRAHPDEMNRKQVGEFESLAADVYKLALAENLLGALPQIPELRPELESQDPPLPPIQFISKLNLSGDWYAPVGDPDSPLMPDYPLMPEYGTANEPDVATDFVFHVNAGQRWFHDMQMLAVLASGKAKTAKAEGTTESRAIAIFLEDNTLTKTQIAERLGLPTQSLAPQRCPQLETLMKAYKEAGPPRGSKSTEGDMESWN